LLVLLPSACSRAPSAPEAALKSFSADRLMQHIKTLSSDEFEGRAPGSKGEQLSIRYIQQQFREAGLEPGNPNGSYLQEVPLVGLTADPKMELAFTGPGRAFKAKFGDNFIAWTKRDVDSVSMDGDLIFVGYGVQAPEYRWDDFKGLDVKGKVLVMLVSNPPFTGQTPSGRLVMTYYGRWTYKFEKAAELGAAGCLIVHETGPAGYPWAVVRGSWGGEQFDLVSPDKNMHRVAVEGWITLDTAQKLFKMAGKDFAALKTSAVSQDFHPVPLNLRAKIEVHNTRRTITSRNVLAKLTGSDPKLKDQYALYNAHWDHLGVGPAVNGDRIYNGARDNASGVAALLEHARAYKQLQVPPRRTMLFLSVTAEEQGLLGSRYYAEHPLYPLARTVAVINMDEMNVWGRTRDVVDVGMGKSTLDDVVEAVAREQGRAVKPDPEPEKGYFYRSDHFSFAKVGVPALDPKSGVDFIGKPPGWGLEMLDKFIAEDYHKPSDEVKPYWDLSGAVEDCRLFFLVGYRVANDAQMPQWKPGTEFKAAREVSLRQAGTAQ
jgi:Zn-dependent M28 family amino/carboxypeptidase